MQPPPIRLDGLDDRVQRALDLFWNTRDRQAKSQGKKTRRRDAGNRRNVTGGKHVDGFVNLVAELLTEHGVPDESIHTRKATDLPGYFRPEKNWDLVVVLDGLLIASIEFKSQVGPSFGNNYNNRTEEAIGNAHDIAVAFREGAFKPSSKPWLGYLMILEETERSTRPVRNAASHFPVSPEFQDASYAKRYETTLTRLVREDCYDGASLLLTKRDKPTAPWKAANEELSFHRFASSLLGHTLGVLAERGA